MVEGNKVPYEEQLRLAAADFDQRVTRPLLEAGAIWIPDYTSGREEIPLAGMAAGTRGRLLLINAGRNASNTQGRAYVPDADARYLSIYRGVASVRTEGELVGISTSYAGGVIISASEYHGQSRDGWGSLYTHHYAVDGRKHATGGSDGGQMIRRELLDVGFVRTDELPRTIDQPRTVDAIVGWVIRGCPGNIPWVQ